jgi:phage replication O-like protein O
MFNKPNYTQTPNDFFDEVAKTLKEGELRVMLVIMRQTFGWGNKQWDRISLSQFVEKTGMEEKSVCRSLQTLIAKKLVIKHKEGPIGREKVWYSLVVENPNEFEIPIDDSNNSYPCPKDRGTPVLKTDTKETLTKERNTNVPKNVEKNVCINASLKEIGGLDDKAKEYASMFATEHEIQDTLEACRYQEKKIKMKNPSSYFIGTLKKKISNRKNLN